MYQHPDHNNDEFLVDEEVENELLKDFLSQEEVAAVRKVAELGENRDSSDDAKMLITESVTESSREARRWRQQNQVTASNRKTMEMRLADSWQKMSTSSSLRFIAKFAYLDTLWHFRKYLPPSWQDEFRELDESLAIPAKWTEVKLVTPEIAVS